MVQNATQAGIDPLKFWEYTPYELTLLIDSFVEKEKKKYKDMITLAYYTEALHRQKRLPKLKNLLKEDTNEEMTSEQMLTRVKSLNAMLGGETY